MPQRRPYHAADKKKNDPKSVSSNGNSAVDVGMAPDNTETQFHTGAPKRKRCPRRYNYARR